MSQLNVPTVTAISAQIMDSHPEQYYPFHKILRIAVTVKSPVDGLEDHLDVACAPEGGPGEEEFPVFRIAAALRSLADKLHEVR